MKKEVKYGLLIAIVPVAISLLGLYKTYTTNNVNLKNELDELKDKIELVEEGMQELIEEKTEDKREYALIIKELYDIIGDLKTGVSNNSLTNEFQEKIFDRLSTSVERIEWILANEKSRSAKSKK